MSQVKATFTGGVVAEPEHGKTNNGNAFLKFPVYVRHAKKNKETGTYAPTGDTTKIQVTLWGDKTADDIRQGDLVEVTATIVEKTFQKRDGTESRKLETDWVEAVTLKHRKQTIDTPSLAIGLDPFAADAPF